MPTPDMRWMRELTGATSSRDIGTVLDKSHATILRWGKNGIPPRAVLRLVAEHGCDLFDTMVKLGWLTIDERDRIAPAPEQLPTHVLVEELHRLTGILHDRIGEKDGGHRG